MDYYSKISLQCPICKGSQFGNDNSGKYLCMSCNNSFTQEQLEKANEKRIQKQIDTTYEKKILPDIEKKLKSDLKKAFRGNPYIKIK